MALTGCMGHLALPAAPPREASYPMRVQAYNNFRPLAIQYTTVVSTGRYGTSASTSATGLLLANGTHVTWPEDLLPLVGPSSPMAYEARETHRVQSIGAALSLSGMGGVFLGVGLFAAGVAMLFSGSHAGETIGGPLAIGGATVTLTAPIPLIIGLGFSGAGARHRETAYQLYDQSLRQNLGLCGDGTQIGDCPSAMGVPGPQPAPGTNVIPPVNIAP
jgi:hypothetical protein